MFRRFKESPYAKAGLTILITGGILIIFHGWVTRTRFSLGFETLNRTLAPVYIGIICAFILCPVYNACVRCFYRGCLSWAGRRSLNLGNVPPAESSAEFIVEAADRRRLLNYARAASSLICTVIVVGLVGLLIYFVVPQVVQSGIALVSTLPERMESLSDWTEAHFSRFPMITAWIDNVANAGTDDIVTWMQKHVLSGNAVSIAGMISNGVLAAVKYVANVFVGLLIMIYLLNYKERLFAISRKFIAASCGQKKQTLLYEFADIVNETFIGFIVGRIIDSFIIGVLTCLVMKIFGIQFALMISVIVGVTNVIPFFGPFIGAIPSVFILMLESPMQALYFIVIIVIIQQIDGNIIGPKIVGNALGLSSFWVLIAVLLGGGLFGFAGMALGVPVFAVFYRYVDKLTVRSLRKKERAEKTLDYFSLDSYGIEDDEILLEPEAKKRSSVLRRKRADVARKKAKGAQDSSADEKAELREYLAKQREAGFLKGDSSQEQNADDGKEE